MGILKEFLDSSTIHGLAYISNPKVKFIFIFFFSLFLKSSVAAKLSWILIVLAGFFGAGYLIVHSYHDWQESPILTTISTHPLDDLEFPIVTVCPPKGSNTALNYDLMQLNDSNNSFTENQRKELKDVIWESLVEKPHTDFAKHMIETVRI